MLETLAWKQKLSLKTFFYEIFLITGWMVLRELHKGTSLEILTAVQVWQG